MRISRLLSSQRTGTPQYVAHHVPEPPPVDRYGVALPRKIADWCFGLAFIGGGVGVVVGIAYGADHETSAGLSPAQSHVAAGWAIVAASLLTAFWLVAGGVFFNWLAATFEVLADLRPDTKRNPNDS